MNFILIESKLGRRGLAVLQVKVVSFRRDWRRNFKIMFGISITLLGLVVTAYLLGSIPFGDSDHRHFWRVGHSHIRQRQYRRCKRNSRRRPAAGILTLLLDTAKGYAAVWLAARYSDDSATWMMIAGLAVLLGHCFPSGSISKAEKE